MKPIEETGYMYLRFLEMDKVMEDEMKETIQGGLLAQTACHPQVEIQLVQ